MTTLKQLLDDIEIDTDDKDDKIDFKEIKLDDLDEKSRPIVEKAMSIMEDQTNEISRRDLMIQTLKDVKPPDDPPPKNDDPPVIDDDPSEARIKKLEDAILNLGKAKEVDAAKEFEINLKTFAEANKDIVRYANDMDNLLKDHPTLQGDIPKLYQLAKSVHERRENPKKHVTETPGMSSQSVQNLSESKSISEAFDLAESKLNKGGS